MSRTRLAVLLAFVFACTDQNEPDRPAGEENGGSRSKTTRRSMELEPELEFAELRRGARTALSGGATTIFDEIRGGVRLAGAESAGREHRAARGGRRRVRPGARGRRRALNGGLGRCSTTCPASRAIRAMAGAGRRSIRSRSRRCCSVRAFGAGAATAAPRTCPASAASSRCARCRTYQPEISRRHLVRRKRRARSPTGAVPAPGPDLRAHRCVRCRCRPACCSRPASRRPCSDSACWRRFRSGRSWPAPIRATGTGTASRGGRTTCGMRSGTAGAGPLRLEGERRRTWSSRLPGRTTATWASPRVSSPRSRARGSIPAAPGTRPSIDDQTVADVGLYTQTLAVPARRDLDDPVTRRGELLFYAVGCAGCHAPDAPHRQAAAGSRRCRNQMIHPYTDLLVHDMGPGLADDGPTSRRPAASGARRRSGASAWWRR